MYHSLILFELFGKYEDMKENIVLFENFAKIRQNL